MLLSKPSNLGPVGFVYSEFQPFLPRPKNLAAHIWKVLVKKITLHTSNGIPVSDQKRNKIMALKS